MPPAAKNLFEKRFLDLQKLFIKKITYLTPSFDPLSSDQFTGNRKIVRTNLRYIVNWSLTGTVF